MSPSSEQIVEKARNTDLVSRSEVPAGLEYKKYRQHLRKDFFYSCAYCTISEFEAQGVRFTIDHYEPQSSKPELRDEYGNLLYCCDSCNILKGNISPPDSAREDGLRFFRPDHDLRGEHFERDGTSNAIKHKSPTGNFTIQFLELNRDGLKRIRALRGRLRTTDRFIVEGVLALRNLRLDEMPAELRNEIYSRVKDAMLVREELAENIDSMLKLFAKSHLLDPEDEVQDRSLERKKQMKKLEAEYPLVPGSWRGSPRRRKTRK